MKYINTQSPQSAPLCRYFVRDHTGGWIGGFFMPKIMIFSHIANVEDCCVLKVSGQCLSIEDMGDDKKIQLYDFDTVEDVDWLIRELMAMRRLMVPSENNMSREEVDQAFATLRNAVDGVIEF